MEKYDANNNYQIVNISRSRDALSIQSDSQTDDVKFSFLPYLMIDEKNMLATSILTSKFINKDDTPLSNELVVRVSYKFLKELPLVRDGENKVKILSYEDLLSIFDTAIGVFRGILYEWLKGSSLQQPLPTVDVEEFLKGLRVSFSN